MAKLIKRRLQHGECVAAQPRVWHRHLLHRVHGRGVEQPPRATTGVKYGFRAPNPKIDSPTCTSQRGAEGFGAEVKRRIMLGTYVLSVGLLRRLLPQGGAGAHAHQPRLRQRVLRKCDAVISPVAPSPAFKIGEKCDDPLQMYLTDIYTVSANLAGIPGISVPCGKSNGLPVGVQFMAPKWREDTLIKLGFAVQELTKNSI